MVSLGNENAGMFANDDDICEKLTQPANWSGNRYGGCHWATLMIS